MKIKLNPNENIRACCLSVTFLRILNSLFNDSFFDLHLLHTHFVKYKPEKN